MKVLFIHNTMPDYRIPFFKKLSEKIDVEYVFTNINLNKKIYNNDINYSSVQNLSIKYLSQGRKHYKELINILKEDNYDYVIIPPMDSLNEYLDAVISFIIAKIKNKKILYFWEKWEAPNNRTPLKKKIKNSLQRIMCKPIIQNVDMCIASGTKSKEYFQKYNISTDKIQIAYDACEVELRNNIENIRKKNKIPMNEKIILYYGRIVERKGLDILIKAFKEVQEIIDDNIHLMICGDGEFRQKCEQLVWNLNIDNVYFEGHINPIDRDKYFLQSDIFVLPSYFYEGIPEAWGLTVNEAIQFKTAIIATTAVGSAFDLIEEENGMMIKESSKEELKNALIHYIKNYNKSSISKKSEEILNKINYDTMSDSFVDALKKIKKI